MRKTFRIVVGVDGSAQAQRALDWALREAALRDDAGQPTLVEVIIAWQSDAVTPPAGIFAHLSDPRAIADATLSHAIATARVAHPGVAVAGLVVAGRPGDVLGRAADGADLLVVGSHGDSQVHLAALGPVAAACVRGSICPVVVIPTARSSSTSPARQAVATVTG
jgi:nucleotide-binding universal stress UspA family protein